MPINRRDLLKITSASGVALVALDAAATDAGLDNDAGDFFLLFDRGPDPFAWSTDEPDGTV